MWKQALFIMLAISTYAIESTQEANQNTVQGCTRRKTQPIDPYETDDYDHPEPDQYTEEGEYRGNDYRGVPQYKKSEDPTYHTNSTTTQYQAPVYTYEYNQLPCNTDLCCDSLHHHFEIGGSYSYLHLKPDGLDHLSGNLGGLQASYEYQPHHCIYQGVAFAWRQGHLDGNDADRSFIDIDTQQRIGYTFADNCGDWLISLFTGLGYRHISQDVSGVDLFYNTFYIPVGFVSRWDFYQDWAIGLNFQWRPQAYPTVRIEPLDGTRWITKYKLANVLVEVPITWMICCDHSCALILKPFFEYWQDGRTTAEVLGFALGLPKNTYRFGGFSLNFRYSF